MNIRDWYSTIEYSPLLIIKWSILEYKSRFKGDRKIQTEFRELTNRLAQALYDYLLHVCTREFLQWDGLYLIEKGEDGHEEVTVARAKISLCGEEDKIDIVRKIIEYFEEKYYDRYGQKYTMAISLNNLMEKAIFISNNQSNYSMYVYDYIHDVAEYFNTIDGLKFLESSFTIGQINSHTEAKLEPGKDVTLRWNNLYSGEQWAKAANILRQYKLGNLTEVMFIDSVIGLEHNYTYILNKTLITYKLIEISYFREILDARRAGEIYTLEAMYEYLKEKYYNKM